MADDELYDPHEFEPVTFCGECDEHEDDCECEDMVRDELDECVVCGVSEEDGSHDV